MDEDNAIDGLQITITRLLLAAVKTHGEIAINISDYMDENLENMQMSLLVDTDTKQFIVSFMDGEKNES